MRHHTHSNRRHTSHTRLVGVSFAQSVHTVRMGTNDCRPTRTRSRRYGTLRATTSTQLVTYGLWFTLALGSVTAIYGTRHASPTTTTTKVPFVPTSRAGHGVVLALGLTRGGSDGSADAHLSEKCSTLGLNTRSSTPDSEVQNDPVSPNAATRSQVETPKEPPSSANLVDLPTESRTTVDLSTTRSTLSDTFTEDTHTADPQSQQAGNIRPETSSPSDLSTVHHESPLDIAQRATSESATSSATSHALSVWDEPRHTKTIPPSKPQPESGWSAKRKNLEQRAGPALVLVAALYAIIHLGGERGLQSLALLLSPGLYYEATAVVQNPNISRKWTLATLLEEWWWFGAYSLVWTIPTLVTTPATAAKTQLAGYLFIVFGLVGTIVQLNAHKAAGPRQFHQTWSRMATCHLATVFTILPCACWMAAVQAWPMAWVLYTAILVILNDTLAYVFGVTLGRRALLPTISPKKTWEGFAGAGITTMLLSPLVWKLLFHGSDATELVIEYGRHGLVLSVFVNTLAPFGGFVASTLKRAYGHKDFGTLIQGHGGLMDRLDCQLFTAPFLYLYLQAANVPKSVVAP